MSTLFLTYFLFAGVFIKLGAAEENDISDSGSMPGIYFPPTDDANNTNVEILSAKITILISVSLAQIITAIVWIAKIWICQKRYSVSKPKVENHPIDRYNTRSERRCSTCQRETYI